jgi:hypothetical protein
MYDIEELKRIVQNSGLDKTAFTPNPSLVGGGTPGMAPPPQAPGAAVPGGGPPPMMGGGGAPGMSMGPQAGGGSGAAPTSPMGGEQQRAMEIMDMLANNPEQAVEEIIREAEAAGIPLEQTIEKIRSKLVVQLRAEGMGEAANKVLAYLDSKYPSTGAGAGAVAPPDLGAEPGAVAPPDLGAGAPTTPEASPEVSPEVSPDSAGVTEQLKSMTEEMSGTRRMLQLQAEQISSLNAALRAPELEGALGGLGGLGEESTMASFSPDELLKSLTEQKDLQADRSIVDLINDLRQ